MEQVELYEQVDDNCASKYSDPLTSVTSCPVHSIPLIR